MTVAILEDNENVREAAAGYLRLEGYNVLEYSLIRDIEPLLASPAKPVDIALLDVMLPDGDSFMLAKRLRAIPGFSVPLVFLTARDGESDRITGFELGADDYVTKPFSPKELVLRVNAILRRRQPLGAVGNRFSLGDSILEIREAEHSVRLDGSEIRLTAAEWNIVAYLSNWPGRVFSRLRILESCLESIAENSERTVDTHVKNIRRKIGEEWIETVRGFGYRFTGARP